MFRVIVEAKDSRAFQRLFHRVLIPEKNGGKRETKKYSEQIKSRFTSYTQKRKHIQSSLALSMLIMGDSLINVVLFYAMLY